VIYDVEMYSAGASQAIRDAFGLFWRKKSGRRLPPELKGISFSNATTFPTRVRLRLLKEICRRHQLANPNLSCFLTSYLARPELKIRDRRGMITSLTYTKAVQQLPHHLTLNFLRELYQYARTNLPEREVIERFLVLTPDLLLGAPPEQLSMSVDDVPAAQAMAVQQPDIQVLPTVTTGSALSVQPIPNVSNVSLMSIPPPPLPQSVAPGLSAQNSQFTSQALPASTLAYTPGTSIQNEQYGVVGPSTGLDSNIPHMSTITYASVTSLPPQVAQVAGDNPSASFTTSTPLPPSTAPAQPQVSGSPPTYAILTPVPVTPPMSGSFLPSSASAGLELSTDNALSKRNRQRFTQKSTPYPAQS
jgi:hypothetical protein